MKVVWMMDEVVGCKATGRKSVRQYGIWIVLPALLYLLWLQAILVAYAISVVISIVKHSFIIHSDSLT